MKTFLKWRYCSTSGQKDLFHLEELLFWNLWYCLNLYVFRFYCQTHQMTVNNLQKMCFKFIWNNKQDKISCKTAIKSGGLGVPDTRKYISALTIMWIRKLKQTWKMEKCGISNLSFYYRFRTMWSKFVQPKVIYFGNMFLRLTDCLITELKPKILASFLLNRCYICTHNGLKRVSTISQILLETPKSW